MTAYHLARLPARHSAQEYAAGSRVVDRLLSKLPGILSVYAAGSVSAPGISDVDRVAVVDAEFDCRFPWSELPKDLRYIVGHTPFLVDAETFRRRRWFSHLEPMTLLDGHVLPTADPPSLQAAEYLLGLEALLLAALRLAKIEFTRRLEVRPFLCEMNNVRHCLRLLQVAEAAAPGAWQASRWIEELRSRWWELPMATRRAEVLGLARTLPPALDEAMEAVADGPSRNASLELTGYWANVTVTSRRRSSGAPVRTVQPWSRSRRISEQLWRRARHTVWMPAPLLEALAERRSSSLRFLVERRAILQRYVAWMSVRPGWSPIGFPGLT
jgi:hypothetical protein